MKFMTLLIGLIILSASLSLLFYPIDFYLLTINIALIVIFALGIAIFLIGMRVTTKVTSHESKDEWGRTTITGRSPGKIFLGTILILALLVSIFWNFQILEYDGIQVVMGAIGLLLIVLSFRKS